MKLFTNRFKFIPQFDKMDCGPACLAMICEYYGKEYSLQYLRDSSYITREGVSLLGLTEAAQNIGFKASTLKLPMQVLHEKQIFPCILHWNQNHFVILKKITKNIFTKKTYFHILDPSYGPINLNEINFSNAWSNATGKGIALLLIPTPQFYQLIPPHAEGSGISWHKLISYVKPFRKEIIKIFSLLLLGNLITLIFPFLTQYLVDKGITAKSYNIITYILMAQIALFVGAISVEIIRNWITLRVGTKLSIIIVFDFLNKILALPLKYFETKMIGDFNQRIQDNERIEHFLTSQSLVTLFSVFSFSVLFIVLWYYNSLILFSYLLLTIISVLWSVYWLRFRNILDYFKFKYRTQNQDSIYELISNAAELKLNQFEKYKINKWKSIQDNLFTINMRVLKVDQLQMMGFETINQIKNIVVTFISASLVIKGKMSLGELLSVSYIVGQMNGPITELVQFFRSFQDAKLSLQRLNEVQLIDAEFNECEISVQISDSQTCECSMMLEGVSFQYEGPHSPWVLRNINLGVLNGKVTAIVGASGSGKTTLLKLLLKFYKVTEGRIQIYNNDINTISSLSMRSHSGVVLQDGHIFSDSIERNIATSDDLIDNDKFNFAVKVANLSDFVSSLPLKEKTKIGDAGNGLSGGQRQRILIARAVYKNPKFLFLDEATSALDAENEKIIHDNLQTFFKGKTVVIIAHRLSTVKNADQIVVLDKGEVAEVGNHETLKKKEVNTTSLSKTSLNWEIKLRISLFFVNLKTFLIFASL